MTEQQAQQPPEQDPNPPATGVMTREQRCRATEEANAIEDSKRNLGDSARKKGKDKEKETFKGKVEKMGGTCSNSPQKAGKGTSSPRQ